jgi:hypothetical protein
MITYDNIYELSLETTKEKIKKLLTKAFTSDKVNKLSLERQRTLITEQ